MMDEFSLVIYIALGIFVGMLTILPILAYFFHMGEGEFLFIEIIGGIFLLIALLRIAYISHEAEEELLKKENLSIITSGRISDDKQTKTFNHRGAIINYVIRDSVIIRK